MKKLDYKGNIKTCICQAENLLLLMCLKYRFHGRRKGGPEYRSDYKAALDSLYGLSYSGLRWSKMNGSAAAGIF